MTLELPRSINAHLILFLLLLLLRVFLFDTLYIPIENFIRYIFFLMALL